MAIKLRRELYFKILDKLSSLRSSNKMNNRTKPPNKNLNAIYESKKRKIEIEDKYYRVP